MLKLKAALQKQGIEISDNEIAAEVCMSHNLLLEYGGGTPQAALTGQYQRPWFNLDSKTLDSLTGALEKRPDYVETSLRSRLLAKQCIQESIIQDRMSRAIATHQHKHKQELLTPGMQVDIWRQPDRKDEDGWRGPAELVSVQRKAASAIVVHQGQPLIIPFPRCCYTMAIQSSW